MIRNLPKSHDARERIIRRDINESMNGRIVKWKKRPMCGGKD